MQRVCALVGVLFSLLSVVSVFAQSARQISVETFYPRHAGAGRTTVINVAVPRGNEVQSAEISPPSGVTVAGVTGNAGATDQAIGWWEIALDVAKDATPGDRSLVLVLPNGRTTPVTISVPTHIPDISDLRITPSNQRGLELQLAAADAAGDLGESPYVWFSADCGGEPIVGALPSKVNARIVRAFFPDLRAAAPDNAPANARCELRVRLTDRNGIESNTLKTTLELRN